MAYSGEDTKQQSDVERNHKIEPINMVLKFKCGRTIIIIGHTSKNV